MTDAPSPRCSSGTASLREAMYLAKNIIHGPMHTATRERNYAKVAEYQSYIDTIDAALADIAKDLPVIPNILIDSRGNDIYDPKELGLSGVAQRSVDSGEAAFAWRVARGQKMYVGMVTADPKVRDVWLEAELDVEPLYAAPQPLDPAYSSADATDAKRYRRLRLLGCAPSYTKHLETQSVLRFSNLDEFVDGDINAVPSRGEASPLSSTDREGGK